MNAPILAGYTLANPSEYSESAGYRGAGFQMADGSVRFDLLSASRKREFKLNWIKLTGSQKAALENAYSAIKDSYAASNYTSIDGTVYTVTRDPAQERLEFEAYASAGALLWRGELRLIEV